MGLSLAKGFKDQASYWSICPDDALDFWVLIAKLVTGGN